MVFLYDMKWLDKYVDKGYLTAAPGSVFVFVKKTPPEVLKELRKEDDKIFHETGERIFTYFAY